jgi:putative transcriptional regulator
MDMADKDRRLLNRLKVARAERDLSQQAVAAMVGVTRQTIISIERGEYCPSARLALLLARALGKRFEDLFCFEEDVHDGTRQRDLL